MAKLDTASIVVAIGLLIVSAALYYKFWYLSPDTEFIVRFLTLFVFGGTAVFLLGCLVKCFGLTKEDLDKMGET